MRWVFRITPARPRIGFHQRSRRMLIVVMMRMVVSMLMTIPMRIAPVAPVFRGQCTRVVVVRQVQRHDERLRDQANGNQHS
jgi:hypothetical protein